ncbi:MAG: hypothetical protein ABSG84_06280 [Acidobacteriaceae bacterium]
MPEGVAHKGIALIVGIVALGGAVGGYAIHEHSVAQSLAAQNFQTTAALNTTQHNLSDLTAKVNLLAARNAAQSETQSGAPAPFAQTASASRAPARQRVGRVDPRFTKLQSQLDAQGEAIEQTQSDLASTQGDLSSTRTELTGSIAHTHDELVLLEKKGERSFAEFDLPKSKQFQREGPLEIRVKKSDSKHGFADLDLMVDDRNLSQKHVNLYQPVMFSTPDSPQPVEIVINSVGKDRIHGYVSAPKYRQSELASMSADAAGNGSPNPAEGTTDSSRQPSPRRSLPMPQ